VSSITSGKLKVKDFIKQVKIKTGILDSAEENRKFMEEEKQADLNHPERLAVLPYCEGRGLDIGCGHRKTSDNCIGVDLTPQGQEGEIGCVRGKKSEADVTASGDDLHMFEDGEMDFIVARHNLEHYVDIIKTLQEWIRVLKSGGTLALVLPDETNINTIALDPTHKHAFTPESFKRYIDMMGGWEIIRLEPLLKDWSFICVCRKK